MASQNGMYAEMKNNIRTLGRPGREQAMKMYKNIWRNQRDPNQELTEGQLEEKMRVEMTTQGEANHAINQRLKRRFTVAMNNRFGTMATWLYLQWGFMDEAILNAMAHAQRDRREDIPVHGGTPVSAKAATHEASQARRWVKNLENRDARWEAANQEGGLCEAEHCDCPQWWSRRRIRCLHCSKKVVGMLSGLRWWHRHF
jgi:formate dehydrogenase maturation protein FdhE